MKPIIFKNPSIEDDYFMFTIGNFIISDSRLKELKENDPYLALKSNKFCNLDMDKGGFEKFKDRPSFRNFDNIGKLNGTIYTYTVEEKNGVNYHEAIEMIRNMIFSDYGTRRCLLRIANSIKEYYNSSKFNLDVSCLSMIHYFAKEDNNVRLVFRASDIKNELFVDIITIYEFFIKPIFHTEINLTVFASTGQNIEEFENVINKLSQISKISSLK